MVNYQQGKIYRLVCNTTGLVYVGSTCEPTLARRLNGHKSDYKYSLKIGNGFITSFKILENNNYEIILIESFPCSSKDELHQRERYYIETMDCVNKNIPTRPKKEQKIEYNEKNKEKIVEYRKYYRENNKEKIVEYKKQYFEENKETIMEKQIKYYEENKDTILEKGMKYRTKNAEKIQARREKNKEIAKAYNKKYHEANKDKINERQRKNYANRKQNNQSTSAPVVSL
jgi:hypothetical protein